MIHTSGWLNTLTGRNLLREEVRQVRRALDGVFGDHFVQLGSWGDPGLFRRLARTRRTAVVAAEVVSGVDVVSAADCVAIASESVDAVLLPHTLELADDPHGVLREVDRILRPHGFLIVLGFNPMGWWGLRHALSRRRFPPDTQRLISERRMADWLQLLEFSIETARYYYFVPPLLRRAAPRHGRAVATEEGSVAPPQSPPGQSASPPAMPTGGPSLARFDTRRAPRSRGPATFGGIDTRRFPAWFAFAGCYVLVACKERIAVTPIRLEWKRRAAMVGSLVNPTTRNVA
jgi:SAM-dependent methyltransferase